MNSKVLFSLLFGILFSFSSYCAECQGTDSQLHYTLINAPEFYRLDQSIGQTQLLLTAKSDGTSRLDKTYEGKWFCLGFNKTTKTYLVAGIFQVGAWLPLGSIQYLSETKNSLLASAFDRQGYIANAALMSPEGRYIAFIGGKQSTGKLYVLDTQTDTIKKLGVAPAPPPLANSAFFSEEPFQWGTGWADGYVELEATVFQFKSENVLQISYGKDSHNVRAKNRKVRIFRMN
jgi:hypothetical protein